MKTIEEVKVLLSGLKLQLCGIHSIQHGKGPWRSYLEVKPENGASVVKRKLEEFGFEKTNYGGRYTIQVPYLSDEWPNV